MWRNGDSWITASPNLRRGRDARLRIIDLIRIAQTIGSITKGQRGVKDERLRISSNRRSVHRDYRWVVHGRERLMCYGGCDCQRCSDPYGLEEKERKKPMMNTAADKKRYSNQCDRILEALMKGPLFNTDLIGYGLSYTRRIKDLREQGYNITCTRIVGSGGLTEYKLVGSAG